MSAPKDTKKDFCHEHGGWGSDVTPCKVCGVFSPPNTFPEIPEGLSFDDALKFGAEEIAKRLRTPDVKKEAGASKPPLVLMPPAAERSICEVLKAGGEKYGYWNWRLSHVETATYISAIKRHLAAIHEGEWLDPESGQPHIAHIGASACILLDADHNNCLTREVVKP
jgi:hypothetical protein